jgi:hypothetical protein
MQKAEYYSLIDGTMESLKDFQAVTVDYVYEQLYEKGRQKMLIADEVGLGKTIVAKGIIAKSFKNYLDNYDQQKKNNATFNVVYICSNLALAKQNIRKLNFTGQDTHVEETINRLNYLALKTNEEPGIFKINSLTPGTSFDQKSSGGEAAERAIIFALLTDYEVFHSRWSGLKAVLRGSSKQHWEGWINFYYYGRHDKIRSDLFKKFRDELSRIIISKEKLPKTFATLNTTVETSLWKGLQKLCEVIDGRNAHLYNFQNELIRELRRILSYLCLEYLGADIFILDEFQRYSSLIKRGQTNDPAIELARRVFDVKDAKVLMLSATPFKPYTNDFDEASGEVHHSEFKAVLEFLMENESDDFWKQYEKDRKKLFQILRHPDKMNSDFNEAVLLKNKLEFLYRKSIVRTERLLASDNREAMIHHADSGKALKLQLDDINDFIILDKVTQHLNKHYQGNLNVPLEYVKSCPYGLSFLDSYQHKEKLRKYIGGDRVLQKILKQSSHAWLDIERINGYLPLVPTKGNVTPNAKLRLLIEKTINSKVTTEDTSKNEVEGWKYLWIPPSLPYYEFAGAYANSWGFSKTLIFSSWKLVPRMVASLVSYEAERLSVGNKNSISEKESQDEKREYFQKRRSPRPQFTFKNSSSSDTPDQMNNFLLLYPSFYLADLYDPVDNIIEKQDLKQLKKILASKIKLNIEEAGILEIGKVGGDYRKWYWLAPLLLDKAFTNTDRVKNWLNASIQDMSSIDAEDLVPDKEEGRGKTSHREYLRDILNGNVSVSVGVLDKQQFDDLCLHLADMCLGSPAVCLLRTFLLHFDLSEKLLSSIYNVASAFITLFNKPESIAILRLNTEAKEYHRSVIEYCVAGNIQALIDEYVYLLHHCDNYLNFTDLANHFSDILSLRSSGIDVDDLKTFRASAIGGVKNKKHSLRTHYAMDFGNQKLTAAGSDRLINLRQSFNSPFRPFVLATTSIGQEGLDFHLYCRKIFHWNLPSNPIDFEQREGRIHRYKGHVIRLNLAKKYRNEIIPESGKNIWEQIFLTASPEKMLAKVKCDLIPFWHLNHGISALNIERYVPIYPFSKDIEKFKSLIKVLTYYRLTFGQPRQEDLVESLSTLGYDSEEIIKLDELIINLSPIHFHKLQELIKG